MIAIAPNGLLIPSTLTMQCAMPTIERAVAKSTMAVQWVGRLEHPRRNETIIATVRTGPYIFAITNYGRDATSGLPGVECDGGLLPKNVIIDVIALCARLNRVDVSAVAAPAVHALHVHSVMELLAR